MPILGSQSCPSTPSPRYFPPGVANRGTHGRGRGDSGDTRGFRGHHTEFPRRGFRGIPGTPCRILTGVGAEISVDSTRFDHAGMPQRLSFAHMKNWRPGCSACFATRKSPCARRKGSAFRHGFPREMPEGITWLMRLGAASVTARGRGQPLSGTKESWMALGMWFQLGENPLLHASSGLLCGNWGFPNPLLRR